MFVNSYTIVSRRQRLLLDQPSTPPCNELISLRTKFVWMLRSETIGYDMTLLGGLFDEIPRRLGHNEALDGFTDAIVHAHASLVAGSPSVTAVAAFSTAMVALRRNLQDVSAMTSFDTLSAIYIMMVYQVEMQLSRLFSADFRQGYHGHRIVRFARRRTGLLSQRGHEQLGRAI